MKKQKGITLIALVITIIIMLILVAVTVSYGIKSGLLDNAKNAGKKSGIEQDRETLLGAATGAYSWSEEKIIKADMEYLEDDGWEISGEDAPYLCTSPDGNQFIVGKNGNVTQENEYNFFYDKWYVCNNWINKYDKTVTVRLKIDSNTKELVWISTQKFRDYYYTENTQFGEGRVLDIINEYMKDKDNLGLFKVENLKFGEIYYGYDSFENLNKITFQHNTLNVECNVPKEKYEISFEKITLKKDQTQIVAIVCEDGTKIKVGDFTFEIEE